jgi:hypothetical protein
MPGPPEQIKQPAARGKVKQVASVSGNEDMLQIVRAILDMSTHLWETMQRFPKEVLNEGAEDGTPAIVRVRPDVLRTASRIAIIQAGNTLQFALSSTTSEYRWAMAKLLTWCAAEAEYKAINEIGG